MADRTALERFEEMFIPEPNSGCWLWIGSAPDNRYGNFSIEGRNQGAHRVSWSLYKNEPIGELNVLHRCDISLCVNPDHLFLGTFLDNTQDMISKGRKFPVCGENNPQAKLTESKINQIRILSRSGVRQTILANFYGVDQSTISNIINRKRWRM